MIKAIAAALVSTLMLTTPANSAEYSALMVTTGPQGVTKTRIFVKGDWRRHEEPEAVVIFNEKTGRTFALMPQEKTYVEMGEDDPGKPEDLPKSMDIGETAKEDGRTAERLQDERIGEYDCFVYRYIPEEDGMGPYTLWYSPELNAAIKIVSSTPAGAITMEYTAIREGIQDPLLFSIPEGYSKTELPF